MHSARTRTLSEKRWRTTRSSAPSLNLRFGKKLKRIFTYMRVRRPEATLQQEVAAAVAVVVVAVVVEATAAVP